MQISCTTETPWRVISQTRAAVHEREDQRRLNELINYKPKQQRGQLTKSHTGPQPSEAQFVTEKRLENNELAARPKWALAGRKQRTRGYMRVASENKQIAMATSTRSRGVAATAEAEVAAR